MPIIKQNMQYSFIFKIFPFNSYYIAPITASSYPLNVSTILSTVELQSLSNGQFLFLTH